jgi:hypothetical protein
MAVSGQQIVATAKGALGTRYIWGGNDLRQGIDCSGLIQQVYKAYGITLPRVTYDQINVGHDVPVSKLAQGDLVFFDTDRKRSGPDHVGIYIGGGKFIHAPRPGASVKISSLSDSYYMSRWMGGRRISGVIGSPEAAADAAEEMTPEPVRLSSTELAETYGMSYAFFNSDKELKKLFKDAVGAQWTPERFQAELKNTKWWKTNSKPLREAKLLQKTDPASYKAGLEASRVAARQAAVKMGAILSAKQVDKLAKNMTDLQWNEAQVQNFLGQYVKFNKDHVLGGLAGAAAKEITQEAYRNGIKTSEQTVKNQAAYVVRGISTMEQVQGELRSQAMGMYPAFAEQIEAGGNMLDLASPYIQATAQELGLPETDIDLYHPKVREAVQRRNAKGEPEPMTITDFTRSLRDDPAWNKTPQAANQAMAVGRQVLADMGLVR